VRGVAAKLLRNYFTNRLQTVCVNGECGSFLPQGGVFGPFLFLIYINDIGSLPLRRSVRLFADDTAIFYPCVEVTELVESVQANLTRLKRYFTLMVFRALNKKLADMPPLFYGTSPIKKVSEVKYLELYMDEQLNFKRQFRLWLGCCTN
jgi:hypothetical protein